MSKDIFQGKEEIFHVGVKALIYNDKGEILLFESNIKDEKPHWDLPGGRIHKHDTIEDTLKRELKEEAGITKFKMGDQFASCLSNMKIPFDQCDIGLILLVYCCSIDSKQKIIIGDNFENKSFGWFVPIKAAELLKVKYPREFTDKIVNL